MQIPAWVDSDHCAVVYHCFSRSPQSPCRETCALLKSPVCSLSFNYLLFDLRHSAMNSRWYLSSSLLLSCHFPSAFFIHSHIPVLRFPCFHLPPGSLSSSPPSLHPSASPLSPAHLCPPARRLCGAQSQKHQMYRFACKLDNCIQVHNEGRKKRGIKGIKRRVMEEQKVKDVCLFSGKVMLLRDEQLFKPNDYKQM